MIFKVLKIGFTSSVLNHHGGWNKRGGWKICMGYFLMVFKVLKHGLNRVLADNVAYLKDFFTIPSQLLTCYCLYIV